MGDEAEYIEGQLDIYEIYNGMENCNIATSVEIGMLKGRIMLEFNGVPLNKYKVKLRRSGIYYRCGVWISSKAISKETYKNILEYFRKQSGIDVIL